MKQPVDFFRLKFLILFSLSTLLFFSCKPNDEKRILGKWESDQDWFEFFENNTYSGGKSIITEFKDYKYAINPAEHALNLYTNEGSQTFYLTYEFRGNDTLALSNTLNKVKIPALFIRLKEPRKP